jgi:hypothetical protein
MPAARPDLIPTSRREMNRDVMFANDIRLKGVFAMFKKVWISILALMLVVSFSGLATAANKGNQRKGKYTYRKVYKACHARGEVDKPKLVLNPDAKTQNQWTAVFDEKDFDQFGCKEEWTQLSASDLSDIYAYLHDHAADSPTPAKCK